MIGVVIADEQCSSLRWFDGNFPMAAHNLTLRAKRYNDSVAYAIADLFFEIKEKFPLLFVYLNGIL